MVIKLVIHGGFYKTGTSSIQNTAWGNRHALKKMGILYPQSGLSDQADEIGYRHSRLMYESKHEDWPAMVEELVEEIKESGCSTVLLSSEAWSRPGGFKAVNQLVEHLQKRLELEPRVIFYLRNVHDYARSHYREFVRRWGYTQGFNDYLTLRRAFFDYKRLLMPFYEYFGTQMEVKPYQKGMDSVSALFSGLGLSRRQIKKLATTEPVNKSVTALDTQVLRLWNQYFQSIVSDKGTPTAAEVLDHIGLSATESHISEKFPSFGFLKNFTKSYHKDIERVTGFSQQQVEELLDRPKQPKVDVETLTPVLKYALMEYIKK